MQEGKKVFGVLFCENTDKEWGHIMANKSSKKLEIIKYSFLGEEIPVTTIPFYSNIEENIQKKVGEDLYLQTTFPLTTQYPGWVLH